jgi:hypothetical protein
LNTFSIIKKFKRTKTLEEITVEETLLFGALFALIPLAILILLTPLTVLFNSLGTIGAINSYIILFMSLSAVCSIIWGIKSSFSYRQFHLLAKFIFAINGGVSMLFLIYSYLVFTTLAGLISYPNAPVIWIGSAINLLLIALLIVFKKIFGEHLSRWFRIKYVPKNASIKLASETIEKARCKLAQKKYRAAGEAFHLAAIVYIDLKKWNEVNENYLRAAEIYAMRKETGVETSFMYCLAAASLILDRNVENALKALENAEKIIKSEQFPDRVREKVSNLLELLTMFCDGEFEKARDLWKSLWRKVIRWEFPIVEETVMLIEGIFEQGNSQA